MIPLLASLAWAGEFDACDAAIDATDQERFRCVYMTARRTGAFDEAAERLRAYPDRPWALLSLAHVQAAVGGDDTEALYREAAAGFGDHDPAGAVAAWLGLRSLWTDAQRWADAREAVDTARRHAGTDPLLVARVDAEDARLLWRTGDTAAAHELAKHARLDGADYQLRLVTLHVLSATALELGRVDESWHWSEALLALTRAEGDLYVEATELLNTLATLDDHPELTDVDPVELARRAVEVAEAGGNPYALAGARCALGRRTHDRALLEACLQDAVDQDDPELQADALSGLAELETDPEAALARLAEAERAAASVALRFTLAKVRVHRAARLWALDRRDESDAAALEAVRTVEAIRDTSRDELERAGFATVWRPAWLEPARRHLDAGDLAGSWDWSERMRARLLLAELERARPTPEAAARVTELIDLLWEDLTPERRVEVQKELADAEHAARVEPDTASLDDLVAALGPDTALVSWQLPDEPHVAPWGFVVDAAGVRAFDVPATAEIRRRVEVVAGLDDVPPETAAVLRADLLDPALALTSARRLVLVLDGPLYRLPIGLLDDGLTSVTVAPSATLWVRWRRDAPVARVLSLAGPDGAGLAWGATEGRAWVDRFDGTLLTGPEATAGALARLPGHGVLHVASHATLDPVRADHQLFLADGPMGRAEIAKMNLDDRVVVLAVCQGADGVVLPGEGVMSLARAFLQAGARAVVASTAPLRDDQASAVFTDLADRLAAGATLGEAVTALHAADRARGIPTGAWAGLVVVGDGSARLVPRPRAWWPWLVGGALALLAGGLALRSR